LDVDLDVDVDFYHYVLIADTFSNILTAERRSWSASQARDGSMSDKAQQASMKAAPSMDLPRAIV
jgi:hypothetical protein